MAVIIIISGGDHQHQHAVSALACHWWAIHRQAGPLSHPPFIVQLHQVHLCAGRDDLGHLVIVLQAVLVDANSSLERISPPRQVRTHSIEIPGMQLRLIMCHAEHNTLENKCNWQVFDMRLASWSPLLEGSRLPLPQDAMGQCASTSDLASRSWR